MKNQKRYLITTADEKTWKFDRPVIFLGEWCRLYDRKHIWSGMDSVVADPYGSEISKRDSDFSKVLALENKLFPKADYSKMRVNDLRKHAVAKLGWDESKAKKSKKD